MILVVSSFLVTIVYAVFLAWCNYQWKRIEDASEIRVRQSNVKVDIIVPVRNESGNMHLLLDSIIKQDYQKENYRIIIVDDHSTDNTLSAASTFFSNGNFKNYLLLESPGKSKKEALSFGIRHSTAELIITTDADTSRESQWLSSVTDVFLSSESYMICSPVKLSGAKSFFQRIQQAEFMGLNVMAAAGIHGKMPMFCNGANLAFRREVFHEVDGYENSKSVSGDDTQLLLKVNRRFPGKIIFNKDKRAIVTTEVLSTEKELFMQRRRWASKITSSLTGFTRLMALNAWFVHVLILILTVKLFFDGEVSVLLLVLMIKILPEIILLRSAGKFFGENISAALIFAAQPFYCLYIVLVGLLSPIKFSWKGRTGR